MITSAVLPCAAQAGWYDSNWTYRQAITIDATKVSTVAATTLSDFPVLISITDAALKDGANGGDVAQGDGGDFLFVGSNDSTKPDHEITPAAVY